MALDGVFLRHIKKELEEKLTDSKVDKIYQPAKDQLVLVMRSREGSSRLLLSARAGSPRINITNASYENPKVPPMLCMLLRKRLSGARLRSVKQPGLERVLRLEFEGVSELGDPVMLTLAMEIMGQYSNIVFVDGEGKIIDAVRRVDASMSSQRLILPGLTYQEPPAQDKLCMLDKDAAEIIAALRALPGKTMLSKALLGTIQGISPIISRELEFLTGRGADITVSDLSDEEKLTRLSYFLKKLISAARECSGEPYLITDVSGKPIDLTFQYIQQYGSGRSEKLQGDFCGLLDAYYARRDALEAMRSRSEDLTRLLNTTAARLIKKIYVQTDELKACADREHFRICGDIIQANLWRIEKGAQELKAENFYDEELSEITIPLDPSLSPSANSQKYYKSYRKAKTAEQVLRVQLSKAEEELDYVSSVLDSLSRAESVRELEEIREELEDQGYVRSRGKKQKRAEALPPLEYNSETGFRILVGRNNRQNDRLTLKQAAKNDIWLHTKDTPGSHVIIVTGGRQPDDETLSYAASIAAAHSKAADSGKTAVDYTLVKYVSKPSGAKPGRVIYTDQHTLYVTPFQKTI